MSKIDIKPGDFFRPEWPFRRDENAIKNNAEARQSRKSVPQPPADCPWPDGPEIWQEWEWKPGATIEGGYHDGGTWSQCDAMGHAEFLVVQLCELPGRYQDRVFYKRTLIDPDGKRWGGKDLRVATLGRFQKWIGGWRPEYVVAEEEPQSKSLRVAAS